MIEQKLHQYDEEVEVEVDFHIVHMNNDLDIEQDDHIVIKVVYDDEVEVEVEYVQNQMHVQKHEHNIIYVFDADEVDEADVVNHVITIDKYAM